MCLQFGVLSRLTWCEYSWDIIEPVTYFIGYGTLLSMYAYYIVTRQVSQLYSSGFIKSCRNTSTLMQGTGSFFLLCIGWPENEA